MAEFIDRAAFVLTLFAIIALVLGHDEAPGLAMLAAVAVAAALVRRGWKQC